MLLNHISSLQISQIVLNVLSIQVVLARCSKQDKSKGLKFTLSNLHNIFIPVQLVYVLLYFLKNFICKFKTFTFMFFFQMDELPFGYDFDINSFVR